MVTNIEQLCGSWAEVMADYMTMADLNYASFAAILGVSEATVRGWLTRQSSPTWNSITQSWHRFPPALKEMLIRPLVSGEFVLTPAGEVLPSKECLTNLAFVAQTEVVTATKRIVEHDRDGQWIAAEVAATGRDVAGLVRRFTLIHQTAAARLAGSVRRQFGWRRA